MIKLLRFGFLTVKKKNPVLALDANSMKQIILWLKYNC